MAQSGRRPLSPHLTIWKWGPHMLLSILHRVTGDGMAILGGLGLTWWLYAAASGPAAYANFQYYVWQADAGDLAGLIANVIARIVLIGLTWAFFQHMLSGLRHLVMDMGAGFELTANKRWSKVILAASALATVAFWAWIFVGRAF
ncbi:succinate dehydrogenase / fumarate reductase cytochrome b subunit [Sphingobium sp. B2D3A]|uniref:succinate dehydrogenase, cytochrome b556 subunit n=1 Tax=unclassified Sphingobium TaxID=2611147 RepID=UPI0022258AB1|nr:MULTISPECIES: succinate dehydrogenase, cytochrome b556 subunit [unclassified Sphingobium]MCW2337303.1 succinate dehydrogenase / fumarate reductase cytochrome b subunit [Sphingobium sp. B2D3A]MCW2388705.1 succinate dehydrogenase / fumarate reductase cytochrome b subunit [Sphingobium sp. B11D3B]MCW2398739.1 succinate dehydrogenase / fumarate reductase cytochrome b subunit [Sphingobium sp. B2D3C]